MNVEDHTVVTHDGWKLQLHRGTRPGATPGQPVVFVPGYGMNGFIFRYHPGATSFMEALLNRGLDPWSVDLRGTASAIRVRGRAPVRLSDQAFVDLPTVMDHVAQLTGRARVDAIGCSLGGSLLYAYGAAVRRHRLRRLVTMGAPLRWTPSALTRAFGLFAPTLGSVPMRGTRHLTRVALPIVSTVVPILLSIYLNPKITRTRPGRMLTRTVEDPIPDVNREIARWMRGGDLILDGLDVSRALADFRQPLLVVVGSGDGICPRDAALCAVGRTGGPVESLEIAHPDGHPVGHADLFISDLAPTAVFPQIADWLLREDDPVLAPVAPKD